VHDVGATGGTHYMVQEYLQGQSLRGALDRGTLPLRTALGLAAEIRSDTWPERVYAGEVVFIGSEAEFTPRNVQTTEERTKLVYPVKVRITGDPDFELKPGIPADVTILEGQAP